NGQAGRWGLGALPERHAVGRIADVDELHSGVGDGQVSVAAEYGNVDHSSSARISSHAKSGVAIAYVDYLEAGRIVRHIGELTRYRQAKGVPGGIKTADADTAGRVCHIKDLQATGIRTHT